MRLGVPCWYRADLSARRSGAEEAGCASVVEGWEEMMRKGDVEVGRLSIPIAWLGASVPGRARVPGQSAARSLQADDIFSRRVLFSFLFSFVTLRQTEFRQPQDTMMDDPVSIMAVAGAARLLTLRQ